jgi:hypothetical protein
MVGRVSTPVYRASFFAVIGLEIAVCCAMQALPVLKPLRNESWDGMKLFRCGYQTRERSI